MQGYSGWGWQRGLCLALILGIGLLTGCATVSMAPSEQSAVAATFAPPAGMANIYIIRREAYMGAAILVNTTIDGQLGGALQTGSYLLKVVPPGPHTIGVTSNENQDSITVTVEEGKNYFLDVKSEMGWMTARFSVHEMPENDGKAAVLRGKLAKGL